MAGREILARWREVGAWWEGEVPREVLRWRDHRGRVHEDITPLSRLVSGAPPVALDVDPYAHREDVLLRPRKTRDEKVRRANGMIREPVYPQYRSGATDYTLLHAVSGYSFGRSVMFATEIARRAAQVGIPSALLADRMSLAGVVEFARDARQCGVKPLIGTTIEMEEGGDLVLVAMTPAGYRSLSHLVTQCHLRHPRLYPLGSRALLAEYTQDVLVLTGGSAGWVDRPLQAGNLQEAEDRLNQLVKLYGRERVFVQVERTFEPWEWNCSYRLLQLAEALGVTPVAGGPVTHAELDQFPAQDVALCSATLATVEELFGRKPTRHPDQPQPRPRPLRALNAERYLCPPAEMLTRYQDRPDLVANTHRVAEMCDDDLLPRRTELPPMAADESQALRAAVMSGAALRHSNPTKALHRRLNGELDRIIRLGFAGHFLMAADLVRWAGDQGILLSGRGSVVDCAVAYCLGISRIDAFTHRLHFDRFLPDDGSKRPDIDMDFEAHRRDDVRNYMIHQYGVDHVATVAAFGAYGTRGILREVGKALGLPADAIGFIAKRVHGGIDPERLARNISERPELRDSGISTERLEWVFRLSTVLADVPRNIRAHSSGVIVSRQPLADTVPVQWSAGDQEDGNLRIIQWDKRSAKHYFDKFDILCLRGQDVLSGTQERVRLQHLDFRVENLPLDDPHTYQAMRSGELVGIPQSASPAMRQAHMRLQTMNLTDASLVQAGIRPGVGGAVKINELIGRRRGTKSYQLSHPDFERILGNTYGILVFQEQVDQLLQVFCGCTSGEAEEIREEIHKRRREDYGQVLRPQLIQRAVDRGYTEAVAAEAVDMAAGFRGYGFAQGHALAFAEISVRSIACQQNFPGPYFAALLQAQPAGYYGPCTIANEARTRGIRILPLDVSRSTEDYAVEDIVAEDDPKLGVPSGGIRLALTALKGLSAPARAAIVAGQPYLSVADFVRRVALNRDELETLIQCGGLDALHPHRRALLCAVPDWLAWRGAVSGGLELDVPPPTLPEMTDFTPEEKAIRERALLGLDVHQHLMAFERERVSGRGGLTTWEARRQPNGKKVMVVGNPIRLRFPPTPSGKRVVFFDLEDETGLLNVTCFDAVYRRDGHAIVCSPYVTIIGVTQVREDHTAFLAQRVFAYQPEIVKAVDLEQTLPITTADFLVG